MEWSWDYEWKDAQDWDPDQALGSRTGYAFEGKNNLKLSLLGAVEAGVKWRLSEQLRLYTGLYADVGFNSVKKITAGNIMEYTPEEWSGNQQEHTPGPSIG